MSRRPLWFGPPEAPLAGWLTEPDGDVRGGVVLCQPLGREAFSTYRTLRRLAEELSARGFVSLLFDYHGTGDSAGRHDDPDRLQSWASSIVAADTLLRERGAGRVAWVAVRNAALLLEQARSEAGTAGPQALVLLDPTVSGRTYLRSQRALHSVSLGPAPEAADGSLETPGFVFPPEAVAALQAIDLRAGGPLPDATLVIAKPGSPTAERLSGRLGPHAESIPAEGLSELLEVESTFAVAPEAAIRDMADWLGRTMSADPVPWSPAADSATAVIDVSPEGAIEESFVSLGPLGLQGVVARPAGATAPVSVVMLNMGCERHIGPSRLWVDLARRWAALGVATARVDFSGLGDSPARPGQPVDVSYSPWAIEDTRDLVQALSPADPGGLTFMGVCSGAYHAMEAAAHAKARAVFAINPVFNFTPPEARGEFPFAPENAFAQRVIAQPTRPWLKRMGKEGELSSRVPKAVWTMLIRSGLYESPASALAALVNGGVDVRLVAGDGDALPLQRRAARDMDRLARTGRFSLEVLPGLDHSLLGRAARETLSRLLTGHLDTAQTTAAPAQPL